ncbi:geranylgeranyl reductase family protein [Lacinutrix chionoecetis]
MITVTPKIDYDCDVLIVGGGPAGSGLAFHLASKGIKVIVAEACIFPRDKICGDGVSPIALAELKAMGITKTKTFKKANEITNVGLFLKDSKAFINLSKPDHLPFHARIIPRIELDNLIFEAAQKAGASYLQGTRVVSYTITSTAAVIKLKDDNKTFSLKAKLIVGADGSNSTIARQLHQRKPKDDYQLLGLRAYYNNVNGPTDRVDIYFDEGGFPGIFWMFPKGAHGANIGIAMISKTLPEKPPHIKDLLTNHINNNPDILKRIGNGEIEGRIDGWPITFFNSEQKITHNRLLMVGEAAGLINPLSGDGIQYALLSARWASKTIEDCCKADNFSSIALSAFTKKVNKEIGYDFALSNLLVQFPRNKSFTKVWMTILTVMIERAKEDKDYADIIAGVFEGTYPSYKALTPSFILKSLKQGGIEIGKSLTNSLKKPEASIDNSLEATQQLFKLIEDLKAHPKMHLNWASNTASKLFTVATHVAKSIDLKDLKRKV